MWRKVSLKGRIVGQNSCVEVSAVFRGTYYPVLDAKNRFFLPAQFRDELGTSVVLFKSPDKDVKCIYLYPEERWEDVSAEFVKKLPPTSAGRTLERKLVSDSLNAEVDKSGRLTVNQQFKEFAALEKELVVVGLRERIEIWSKSEWQKEEAAFAELSVDEFGIVF